MGQKTHPYGLRVGYIKPWKARWYARSGVNKLLHEDLKLRDYIKKKLGYAGVSNIEIERSSGRVRVRIFTARPGVIIGRRGQEIEKVREELMKISGNELFLDIKEVKSPQTDAQLVAENIASQLEKRIAFRRAMKRAVQIAMEKGALGIKVLCKGRLGGSEIARHEKYSQGKVPLTTLRADVDYGFTEAHTTYGSIGCKVWIYNGDILIKKEIAEAKRERERKAELELANEASIAEASKKTPEASEGRVEDSSQAQKAPIPLTEGPTEETKNSDAKAATKRKPRSTASKAKQAKKEKE